MDAHVRVDLDDDGPVVVKATLEPGDAKRIHHERARLRRAEHPGVVALAAADTDGDELRIRYSGEAVARWSGPVDAVAGLGAAVAETLADLHDAGIVHGRVDDSHILIGDDGRPRLCSLAGPGDAEPADDVAALGEVLHGLLARAAAAGSRRRRIGGRGAARGGQRRALERVLDAAVDPVPSHRPTARALAGAIVQAVPAADLPAVQGGPAGQRRREPDTLDRIWAVAGDESDDERWAAALGPGPPDLPAAAEVSCAPDAYDLTADTIGSALPLADNDTPAWPGMQPDEDHRPQPSRRERFVEQEERRAADTGPGARARGGTDPIREPQTADAGPAVRARGGTDGEPQTADLGPATRARGGTDLTRERRPTAGRVSPSRAGTAEPPSSGRGRRRVAVAASGVAAAVATAAAIVVIGSGRAADTSRPDPPLDSSCAPVDGPAADVDGDGCPEALVVDGSTVDAGVARWSLGEPGDVAAVGDWNCDGEASAALLRPTTGDVFLFADWAEVAEPVTVRATRQVAGGIGIRAEAGAGGCDRLLVDLPDGTSTPVEVPG